MSKKIWNKPFRNMPIKELKTNIQRLKKEIEDAQLTLEVLPDELMELIDEFDRRELKENNCDNGNNPDASCYGCPQTDLCA